MTRLDLAFSRGLGISQASDFTFTDDCTPISVDDSSGSTGSMHVNFDPQNIRPALMKGLKGQAVEMSTAGQESRSIGTVTHVSGSEAGVGIDIDSISFRLAVTRTAKPFVGRLDDAVRYWASLVQIDSGDVGVESAIAAQQVALVGFRDNVWLRIKQFCAAVGIEVVIQDDVLLVRRPRSVLIETSRMVSKSWDTDDTNMAHTILVSYYDPRNVVAGDYTADYSRSNVASDDADDPNGGLVVANAPANRLPPGYTKVSVIEDS